MKILNHKQINQKIRRIAIQIVENHYNEERLVLAGLNNNGYAFAQLIVEAMQEFAPSTLQVIITRIKLNPANPLEYAPYIELDVEQLRHTPVIIVDDVANTGRTLFYAIQPLLQIVPKKVELAVLVDRTHKSFPVKSDYVGMSLATTLKDNIKVAIRNAEEWAVYLE